jgi:hypothetical protein
MKLRSLIAFVILVAPPCFAQTTSLAKPTIKLGKTLIYIGMPQEKAMAALASDGFVLDKVSLDSKRQAMYFVSHFGSDGKKTVEGSLSFIDGKVFDASQEWHLDDDSGGTFARELFLLTQKLISEDRTSCTLETTSTVLDTEDAKNITIQCVGKAIQVDLTEYHGKNVGSSASLRETIRKN